MTDQPGDVDRPFPSLAEMAHDLPPITWLWPGWIPRGMLTLLCAAPGTGKSYVALDLARRLISGSPLPDGSPLPEPVDKVHVVYVDAERSLQLLNERTLVWNMDRSRLFPLLPVPGEVLDFTASRDQQRLSLMVNALCPALLVVDSLDSVAPRGAGHGETVRAVLRFLDLLAARFQLGVLLIHHLRNQGPSSGAPPVLDDVKGPSHIVSMARSVLALSLMRTGLDLERNSPRLLEALKGNLGPCPDPLEVAFVPIGDRCVLLRYRLASKPYNGALTQTEMCARWILDRLHAAEKPVKPSELVWRAGLEGYSRATFYRARELLGRQVVDTTKPHDKHNRWAVPGAVTPERPQRKPS